MPAKIDIVGRDFERLFVFSEAPSVRVSTGALKRRSWVRCECGSEFIVLNESLISGNTKSCGCLNIELIKQRRTSHGHCVGGKPTRTYRIWKGLITRCTNERRKCFDDYAGRNITVCDRWRHSYENFLSDMGEAPPRLTIHRVDNDGNYAPGNCIWATYKVQARNTRRNRIFTVRGITDCLIVFCERFNVPYSRTRSRLQRGWNIERALFTPKLT